MKETLLVCSKSTRKYLPEYERVFMVSGSPKKELLQLEGTEDNVVAIGGGAVIDTAKILAKDGIICYPTTAAGSSATSHSVCWDGDKKMSIYRTTPKEVRIEQRFVDELPEKVKEYTTYDVISHCLDGLWSKNRTKESEQYAHQALSILKGEYTNSQLIEAGNLGGKAIQICPTTILHAISYPLTGIYGVPHGKALGYLLPRVCNYFNFDLSGYYDYSPVELTDVDWDLVREESLKYDKIYNVTKPVDNDILIDILS